MNQSITNRLRSIIDACLIGDKSIKNRLRSNYSVTYKSYTDLVGRVDNVCVTKHAYQLLACETAINTDFNELLSLKRIYVKYKNAILSLIDCFFRT